MGRLKISPDIVKGDTHLFKRIIWYGTVWPHSDLTGEYQKPFGRIQFDLMAVGGQRRMNTGWISMCSHGRVPV